MSRYSPRKNPRTEDDDFRVFLDYVSGIDSVEFLAEAHNIPVASVEMILDVYLDDALDDSQELRFNPAGRPYKFTESQKDEIAEKYRNDESHTLASLALEYNCSAPTIKKILIEKNAFLRGSKTPTKTRTTLTSAQELDLVRRYQEEPRTKVNTLCSEFSISKQTVYDILKRHGIDPSRPQSGGAQRALTPDQELELIRHYQEDPDTTIETLSSAFSITPPTLQRTLKRHGIEPSRLRSRSPDEEHELIRRYQEELNTTLATLAADFSISITTLQNVLKRHGVERSRPIGRPRSQG